jgi:hypothetical protein
MQPFHETFMQCGVMPVRFGCLHCTRPWHSSLFEALPVQTPAHYSHCDAGGTALRLPERLPPRLIYCFLAADLWSPHGVRHLHTALTLRPAVTAH